MRSRWIVRPAIVFIVCIIIFCLITSWQFLTCTPNDQNDLSLKIGRIITLVLIFGLICVCGYLTIAFRKLRAEMRAAGDKRELSDIKYEFKDKFPSFLIFIIIILIGLLGSVINSKNDEKQKMILSHEEYVEQVVSGYENRIEQISDERYNEGFNDGYNSGFEDGFEDGYSCAIAELID